ncbi:MAG: hypothetical protein PHW03_05280 [Eubacteriales bacterium]|nr:hypothetical protein [Eubacteriales bacterium]
MKIIKPITITEAMLTSTDVPENDYTAYNAGTTYTKGDRCISGHKIYESLPLSDIELLTLDVAPAIPWLPDWTLTGQTSLSTCKVVQYLTSTTYYVKSRSGAFTLGEIIGVTGTASLLADQGAANPTFTSAPNVGHDPATDLALETPIWWKEVSATNRWKPFDAKVGSQVSQATSLTYKITPGELFDSIAFINVDAVTIQVTSTDPVAGVVYDEILDLLNAIADELSGVYDWYSYFFADYFRIADIAVFNIPPYLNTVLDITITYTGGTVLCGGIVLGLAKTLGGTEYGASIGITDYSVKTTDDYGVTSIDERDYSKKMNFDIEVKSGATANLFRLLASYRATALVWIGEAEALFAYGYAKDWTVSIAYPDYDIITIEIEGLT